MPKTNGADFCSRSTLPSGEARTHVLGVSRSGYYGWLHHKPGKRELANQALDSKIQTIFDKHKKRYGAPRIAKALQAQNEACSDTRVARRMKKMYLSKSFSFNEKIIPSKIACSCCCIPIHHHALKQ